MLLAGDVGGTKTHLALFSSEDKKCVSEEKFVSRDFPSLAAIVENFLSSEKVTVEKACFGVPGPVKEGSCRTTNLPWELSEKELSKQLKISTVKLINDLEAHAWGVKVLTPEDFSILNQGKKEPGNQALIAAGTGLGEAGLYWDGVEHHPFACEGGHSDFAPKDELEMELLRYLTKKIGHVSYERIVSGMGLPSLYRFLIEMRLEKELPEVKQEMLNRDPAQVITERGLKKECKACTRALNWFASLYGSAAGNLALQFLALGGVYIGGGIAPKILPVLQSGLFMKAFCAKGRFSTLLSAIPVKVVLNERTALIGACQFIRKI